MKTIKRYFSIFMCLAMLGAAMVVPSASSYMLDWVIRDYAAYFEYNYGMSVSVKEDIAQDGDAITNSDGNILKQNVKIENTGTSPCYIKVIVGFSAILDGSLIPEMAYKISNDNFNIKWNENQIDYTLFPQATNNAERTIEGPHWILLDTTLLNSEYSDGQYRPYCFIWNTAVNPGEETANLINSVTATISELADEDEDGQKRNAQITIDAEGIYEGDIEAWCSTYGIDADVINRTLTIKGVSD